MNTRTIRAALAALAISAAVPGLWATLMSVSFHADFPGLGLHWVGPLGPYDEHLVRDVGGFYLALAALSAYAAKELLVALVRATAIAWLVFQLPHIVAHINLAPAVDGGQALQLAVLAAQAAIPVGLLMAAPKLRDAESPPPVGEGP